MEKINKYLELNAFSLNKEKKNKVFFDLIKSLTRHHYNNSAEYKKILDVMLGNLNFKSLNEVPFLPTLLFKNNDIKSVNIDKVIKTLTSSGTSGNSSKIFLDKINANNQIKVLNKIISTILGKERLPMLIIDENPNLEDRSKFNARRAAIQGFSIFGKNHTYLLNQNGKIDYSLLNNFLQNYANKKFFIFGFTSYVFQNLYEKLNNKKLKYDFENAILIHGGGWKKMENKKISNFLFKKKLFEKLKIKNVINYYGLVEQTGSIFIECEKCESFISSIFSEVLIRDKNFNIQKPGERGLVQLFSILPTSYPGHSIITEDIGEIVDNKSCKCSLKGTRFIVHGRTKHSEIRGCSDV